MQSGYQPQRFDTSQKVFLDLKTMPYEPGSSQCLGLIAAKENLLSAMNSLNKVQNTDQIQMKLKEIYKELDEIHDGRKLIENEL